MLKLSIERAENTKKQPYFEIRYWNIPKESMNTYTKVIIESNDLLEAKRYLTHLFLLKRKIKNKEISINDLTIREYEDISGFPSFECFYEIDSELKIEVQIKEEYSTNPEIVNIDFWYAKYFDEYGVEYDIKIEEISKVLEKF
tara:strand:- start:1787 stop:2215 length:429 start_codon:yes stop_codon:yes gene_type:complete